VSQYRLTHREEQETSEWIKPTEAYDTAIWLTPRPVVRALHDVCETLEGRAELMRESWLEPHEGPGVQIGRTAACEDESLEG
jgi:hypothetical protein